MIDPVYEMAKTTDWALRYIQTPKPILDTNRLIAWCREHLTADEQRAVHLALADSCDKGHPQDGCLCHERGWRAAEAEAARVAARLANELNELARGFNAEEGAT